MTGPSPNDVEARLRRLEDEREIARVVARYGPLVDSGSSSAAELWQEDGVYDVDGWRMEGAGAIADMVASRSHQAFVTGGCAHFQGPVDVVLHGDEAEALGYSLMLVRDADCFRVHRATANHWRLVRAERGWRVDTRTSRALDGGEEAQRVLGLIISAQEDSS